MNTALLTLPFMKQIVYITIIIGANLGFNVLLHYVFNNALYTTLLSYIGIFLSIMVVYFLIFDFTITAFFSFMMALVISVLIAIFLMIFMSPTYCSTTGGGSNAGVYFETFLYGLLVYLIYLYVTVYVVPFYNNIQMPNQLKYDIIFGGMIVTLGLIIWILNAYVDSEVFKKINLYTALGYALILFMKIYIIGLQAFNPPAMAPQLGGYERLVREPDYIRPARSSKKSAFYNLH